MFKKKVIQTALLVTTSLTTLSGMTASAAYRVFDTEAFVASFHSFYTNWRNNNNLQANDNISFARDNQHLRFDRERGYNGAQQDAEVIIANIVFENHNNTIVAIEPGVTLVVNSILGATDNAKLDIHANHVGTGKVISNGFMLGLNNITLHGGGAEIRFNLDQNILIPIKGAGMYQGHVNIDADVIFNNSLGELNRYALAAVTVNNNKTLTLKNNVHSYLMPLGNGSRVNIDPSQRDIIITSGIASNGNGAQVQNEGTLSILSDDIHTVTLNSNIGEEGEIRIAEIDIQDGAAAVTINGEAYSKIINIGDRPVIINSILGSDDIKTRIDELNINGGNVTFNEEVHANNVRFNDNSNINVNHATFVTNNIRLGDANLLFSKQLDRAINIEIATAHQGDITFVAAGPVGAIGALNTPAHSVSFSANGDHTLYGDINTDNITFGNGVYDFNDPNIKIIVPAVNLVNNIPANLLAIMQTPAQAQLVADQAAQAQLVADQAAQAVVQLVADQATLTQVKENLVQVNLLGTKLNEEVLANTVSVINRTNNDKVSRQQAIKEVTKYFSATINNAASEKDLPDVLKSDSAAVESVTNSLSTSGAVIDSRMSRLSVAVDAPRSGVTAGENAYSYGVWIKGSIGSVDQKAYQKTSGYKISQKGVTIGADTDITDDSLVGIAYSAFQSDVKNKDSATKDKVNSHIVTAYGKYVISDSLFVNAQAQAGKAFIKKARASGSGVASAKTKSTILGAKAELGYVYNVDSNLRIVPTAGIKLSQAKIGGYKETGALINKSVDKKTKSRTSFISGVSAAYVFKSGDLQIVPEIHANIDYSIKSKDSATRISIIDGMDPIVMPSEKATKAIYNLGSSVNLALSDSYEVSAGYDFGFSKKFTSHAGSLKLRLNF